MADLDRRGFLGMGAATLATLAAGRSAIAPGAAGGRAASGAAPKVKTSGVRMIPIDGGKYHMCLWDDQEAYFRGLLGWIRDTEAGSAKRRA